MYDGYPMGFQDERAVCLRLPGRNVNGRRQAAPFRGRGRRPQAEEIQRPGLNALACSASPGTKEPAFGFTQPPTLVGGMQNTPKQTEPWTTQGLSVFQAPVEAVSITTA